MLREEGVRDTGWLASCSPMSQLPLSRAAYCTEAALSVQAANKLWVSLFHGPCLLLPY